MLASYYPDHNIVIKGGGESGNMAPGSMDCPSVYGAAVLHKPYPTTEPPVATKLSSSRFASASDRVLPHSRPECYTQDAARSSLCRSSESLAGVSPAAPASAVDPSRAAPPLSSSAAASVHDAPATSAAAATAASNNDPSLAAGQSGSSGVLLDAVLPMRTQLDGREEGMHELGLCVRVGRGGPSQVSRLIQIRLTDPADPFLLFELELREEDYAAFKQRLELRVDFHGFPRHLVSMLHRIAEHAAPLNLSFMVHRGDGGSRATLRVVEATEFKTVEHVSLLLVRQGDVAQKRYLAERLQHYTNAYHRSCAEAEQAQQSLRGELQAVQQRHEALVEQHAALRTQAALAEAQAEQTRLSSLSDVRAEAAAEMQQLRVECERQLRSTQQESTSAQRQLRQELQEKDSALSELRERLRVLSVEQTTTQTQREQLQDLVDRQTSELAGLREAKAELEQFKQDATNAMSENELNYVALTERLRAATASLRDKENELNGLREQYHKQDGYIHILTTQNTQLREQNHHMNKSLKKSHHIIGHQLHTIKASKERYHTACDRIRTSDSLLHERQTALQRTTEELTSCQERLQSAQKRCAEWKEQLQCTDDARETLAQELQRTQAALVQLQRSTGISGRHWSALMMAGAANANTTASSNSSGGNALFAASRGLSAPSPLPNPALRQEKSPAIDGGHGEYTSMVNHVANSAKSQSISSSCGMTAVSAVTTHSPSPTMSATTAAAVAGVRSAARAGVSTDLMREFDRHARSVSHGAAAQRDDNASTLQSSHYSNMDSVEKTVSSDPGRVHEHSANGRTSHDDGQPRTRSTTELRKPPVLSAPARVASCLPAVSRHTLDQGVLPRHQVNKGAAAVAHVSSYF